MKTKLVAIAAALIGAATLSAQAGVYVSIHLPLPPLPVVVVRPPAPVVVAPPVVCAPATPVVAVEPPCPGPGYVWTAGYWGVGHVWVAGCWRPGPHAVVYAHPYYGHPYGWHRW